MAFNETGGGAVSPAGSSVGSLMALGHLQALTGQGSSVESLLIGRLQVQGCVAVLLGLGEHVQLQVAQSSASTQFR